jgi:hypothetical protein
MREEANGLLHADDGRGCSRRRGADGTVRESISMNEETDSNSSTVERSRTTA